MSFLHRTLWLFVSALVAWLSLCILSFIHSVSSSPVEYWRATYQPWSRIGLDIDIWSRMYLPIFVIFAVPACYFGRLPALLWKRAFVGGILFSCGGIAWALFYFGVLGAISSRPQGMEFDVWFWGLIMRRLISFSLFFFPVGAVAFSFLPPRRVATKTSNQSLEPTAGRRDDQL
jgi:hypothetical protein